MLVLLLLILPSIGHFTRADVVELNHVYHGKDQWFTQWVVWDWYEDGYHVRDWSMKGSKQLQVTLRRVKGERVELRRRDSRGRVWVVRAHQFRETWTMDDVEVADRIELPICERARIWNGRR